MAKHRYSEILADESITTAGTKTIDVNLTDPISAIFGQVRLTNNGSTPTGHPVAALPKIEVVDGSDVICSLTGRQAQAKQFFDQGKPPLNILAYLNDVQCIASFVILFGRYPWDEEMGLDPTRFNNLQIKIQHNYALGGSSPDAATLQVYGMLFDSMPPSLKGFIQSKEIYSYSLTSGAYEYVELPRDYPLRRLILQSLAADKAMNDQLNEVKLSEDHDKKIIIEEAVSNLIKFGLGPDMQYNEEIFGSSAMGGVDHYVTPVHEVHGVFNAMDSGVAIAKEETPGNLFKIISASATPNVRGLIRGYCPHGCFPVNFGDPSYPPDAWDVTGLKSARLRIKGGSSVGSASTAQVVAEQYRMY